MIYHPRVCLRTVCGFGLFVLLGFATNRARANPVYMTGVGGTPCPVGTRPSTVRMLWQEVRVELPSRRVVARYAFRNDGPATTVAIGMPEDGNVEPGPFPYAGFLREFHSFVDGRPVRPQRRYVDGDPGRWETEYHFLWTRSVRFERGQTRILEDRFISGSYLDQESGPEGGAIQLFSYNLAAGAKWKSKIERCRVTFDIAGLKEFSDVKFDVPGGKRRGQQIVWEWRDFEPKPDFSVSANWWPGFKNISINGSNVYPRAQFVGDPKSGREYKVVYPRKIGSSIWVPLRLISEWLPPAPRDKYSSGEVSQGAYRVYRGLYWNGLNVGTEVGTPYLDVTGQGYQGRSKMSAPSFDQEGATMVELTPLVLALGGKVNWNPATNSLDIVIHPSP
ncbi:hypothetical protein IAD21_05035 [Abditibacteriota bacterium]|nr:hypothetical protein IAD21_05035 [Abditibacteriota bacterium]